MKTKEKPEPTREEIEDSQEYAQDWLPFEKTVYGMYKTKDGRYVKVIEIIPITFMLRSEEERAAIIGEFYAWLKIAPKRLQLRMTTEYTNTRDLIKKLDSMCTDTDEMVLRRQREMIDHIRSLSTNETLSHHFYIIYQYEGEENGRYSKDEETIYYRMESIKNTLLSYFRRMESGIVVYDSENVHLDELLYKELNPKTSQTEDVTERATRVYSDAYLGALGRGASFDESSIEEGSYVVPRGLSFENSSYVIKDGIFEGYLYVRPNGYHERVTNTWFTTRFANFGENVSVNVYASKRERTKTIAEVRHAGFEREAEKSSMFRGNEEQERLDREIGTSNYIKTSMADYNEDLYDVYMQLTIRSNTLQGLMDQMAHIKNDLRSRDWYLADTKYHMQEACRASLPLLCDEPRLFRKGYRNFLTSSLASLFMYTGYDISDEKGLPIGTNENQTLLAVDPYNSNRYANANMVVIGSSGRGKSYLLMSLAYYLRLTGRPVFVILPEKGHEWKRLVRAMNGTYIELAPGSESRINLMAIRPQENVDESMVDSADIDDSSLLSKKIQQIITWLQLNKPNDSMTDEEESSISTTLTQLYADFGITTDNDSIWQNKEQRILKPMPIIEDFYKLALKDTILQERIAVILKDFVEGDCKNMNGQTNVDTTNPLTVISVAHAGKRRLASFSFLAIDCAYDIMKQDRTQQCALIMDELWKLMFNKAAAEFCMEIYKICRGYSCSAISATQNINDITASKYGGGIVSNAKLKLFLGVEKEEARNLEQVADMTDAERKMLTGFERGQALFVANNDKIPINIRTPERWDAFFTTDSNRIAMYKEMGIWDSLE